MSLREKTVYNALPKLPGFQFSELNEPATRGRRQYCVFDADGTRTVRDAPVAAGNGVSGAGDGSADPLAEGCGIPVQVILDRFPAWRTLDGKVLRFFGYYMEAVDESTIEQERVRKVKLQYHLSDGTLSITETPAVVNSGLRKGTTVARFKPANIDVFSLCIGCAVTCRGIEYELVDCDAATREFYDAMGMPLPPPLDYPYDKFEASKAPPIAGAGRGKDEQHEEMKRAVEMQAAMAAGTHASLLTSEERAAARSFFAHDGDVLRFYAVWDKRQFRIQYYLADNTVSIMFDAAPNDGRDAFPVFARRAKIPKDTRALLLQTETLNRPLGEQPAYITWRDLQTGTTVDLNGRSFYLYDCDAHTRQFLEQQGLAAPRMERPLTELDDYNASKRPPSLSKGERQRRASGAGQKRFGASAMVFDEDPAAAAKDPVKMTRFAQDVLRFLAYKDHPAPTDAGRSFLVSYYLADDTVSVYELVARNSGHVGGKIFARRPVEGINTPKALHVGKVVKLDGVEYRLTAMDERTRQAIEAGMPDNMDDDYFRLTDLISKARQVAMQKYNRTSDLFRHYASSSTRGLTRENMLELFADAQLHPSAGDMDAIMARVDSDADGWVSLADFTDRFLAQQFSSDFKPQSTLAALVSTGADPEAVLIPRGPIQSAQAMARKANAECAAEEAFRKFLAVTEARRTLLTRSFRNVAEGTYDGNLGAEDFADCVTARLRAPMSEEEVGALIYKFFYTPGLPNWMSRRLPLSEVHRLLLL